MPVLSSSSTSTSPAASTARPLIASTFFLYHAVDAGDADGASKAPIVVGIRHTNGETNTVTVTA